MANYPPPSENLPIFDALVFLTPLNATITAAEADAKYLARQDVAVSIAQTTSFSDNITIGNSLLDYIPAQGLQIKPTVNTEAVFLRVLDGAGATKQRIECNQTHQHLYDQTRLTDSATPTTNYTTLQQSAGGILTLENMASGSTTYLRNKTAGGVTRTPITLTSAGPVLTGEAAATGLNGIQNDGAIFGRNDTGANTFNGTLGYTRHPIGWTIVMNKVIANLPSANTNNIITFGTTNTEFATLSNGLWLLGCNISNATSVGVCSALSTQWGVGGGGTLLNTAQFTLVVTGLFQLDASNAIFRATGDGITSIIYNVYPTWSMQPTFTFNMYAIKLA